MKVILAMNRIYYWLLISLVKILNKNLEKKLDRVEKSPLKKFKIDIESKKKTHKMFFKIR